MARIPNVVEGMVIALDTMRNNKLRSGLTILGVVIGVATVMTIASMVQGIRTQIFNAVEVAGPTTFYVVRFFSQVPLNPDRLPYEVRIRPPVNEADAAAVAGPAGDLLRRASGCRSSSASSTRAINTQSLSVFGADEHYLEIQGGTLLRGAGSPARSSTATTWHSSRRRWRIASSDR